MQPFSVRPDKGISMSRCEKKKTCKWRDEQEVTWIEGQWFYGGDLWSVALPYKHWFTQKHSLLPVCFRLRTKAKRNRETAQSLKKQYLQPLFAERELQNICWPVGKKGEKQKNTLWTLVLEVIPVFLADPWTPAPTAPLPGLPGVPVFLLKRLLKKLASTPSLAAPAAEESEQKPPWIATIRTKREFCFLLAKLLLDRLISFHPKS